VNRPPITRISRKALLIIALIGGALALVVLVLGFGEGRSSQRKSTADENALRPSGPIESVKDLPQDYSFDVAKTIAAPKPSKETVARSATLPSRSQDPALAQALRDLAEQRRKLLEQQLKEQQAALDSPLTFLGNRSPSNSASSNASRAPAPTSMPTLVMLGPDNHHAATTVGESGNETSATTGPSDGILQNHQQEKELFLTQASAVETYLSKPLLTPLSRYELKAGSVIPAALLTAINTDLPGETIAQVTENVYDSATGNSVLIPQGSRLLGKYQSLVTNGQNRALLVWQRLIYPNGNSIVLDTMPGTDESGRAGLADKVDYHATKLAEAVALTTALAYGGNLARDPKSTSNYSNSDVVGDTVAQEANRIGEKVIDRQLDVQPTITVRPGWPLRVLVNKDIVLAPYTP
jgi:type IV secretion system protein VirB10